MISTIRQKKEGFQGKSVSRRISHMSQLRTVNLSTVAPSQQLSNLKRLFREFRSRVRSYMIRECKRKDLGLEYESQIQHSIAF